MPDKCIRDPKMDCLGLIKAHELERDLNDLRKQNSNSHERIFDQLAQLDKERAIQSVRYDGIMEKISTLTDSANKLTSSNKEAIDRLENMVAPVKEIDKLVSELEALKSKPAKRYEDITKQIIGIIIAAILALVLTRIGLQ